MNWISFWCMFCAMLPLELRLYGCFFSVKLANTLVCECQPCLHEHTSPHVQPATFHYDRPPVPSTGQSVLCANRLTYTRDQLVCMPPTTLEPPLIACKSINFNNSISVPRICYSGQSTSANISIALFNARSVGLKDKRSAIIEFILDNGVDVFCVTETWLRAAGDEARCKDLSRPGYTTIHEGAASPSSFPIVSARMPPSHVSFRFPTPPVNSVN